MIEESFLTHEILNTYTFHFEGLARNTYRQDLNVRLIMFKVMGEREQKSTAIELRGSKRVLGGLVRAREGIWARHLSPLLLDEVTNHESLPLVSSVMMGLLQAFIAENGSTVNSTSSPLKEAVSTSQLRGLGNARRTALVNESGGIEFVIPPRWNYLTDTGAESATAVADDETTSVELPKAISGLTLGILQAIIPEGAVDGVHGSSEGGLFPSRFRSYFASVGADSSTAVADDEEVATQLFGLLGAAHSEDFENGVETEFSAGLRQIIVSNGEKALRALTKIILDGQVSTLVSAEALYWVAHIGEDVYVHSRLMVLWASLLRSPSSRVRVAATLGLADLFSPRSLGYLKSAHNEEKNESVKRVMRRVIALMEK